jgi:hypothetical protein
MTSFSDGGTAESAYPLTSLRIQYKVGTTKIKLLLIYIECCKDIVPMVDCNSDPSWHWDILSLLAAQSKEKWFISYMYHGHVTLVNSILVKVQPEDQ